MISCPRFRMRGRAPPRPRAIRGGLIPVRDHARRARSRRRHRETGAPRLPGGGGAAARVGLDVIVDEVVIDRATWDDWTDALAGLDVVWVGIRCSPEVAEERNKARGLAASWGWRCVPNTATVHRDAADDFEIDDKPNTRRGTVSAHSTARILIDLGRCGRYRSQHRLARSIVGNAGACRNTSAPVRFRSQVDLGQRGSHGRFT